MRPTELSQATPELSSIEDGFSRLWERFSRPLAYVVSRRLSGAEIDDAVQEIMLRVFEKRAQFDATRSLAAWVYTIARNYCSDEVRRRSRRAASYGQQVPDETVDIVAPHREEPEPLALRGEEHRELHKALESLADTDRLILFLHYFEELPLSEIAHVVGRPAGTVKYRVHVAKRAIRRQLEGQR